MLQKEEACWRHGHRLCCLSIYQNVPARPLVLSFTCITGAEHSGLSLSGGRAGSESFAAFNSLVIKQKPDQDLR